MKKSISIILLCIVLLFAAFDRYMLKDELKELKTKERYSISVGDTTLQIIRKLKIDHKNKKVLDIQPIHKGKNHYYFQLNETTIVEMYINKY